MDTPANTIAIRPAKGRRLILPDGCSTLDGVPLAQGVDLPDVGALVPRGVWPMRSIAHGDAEELTEAQLAAAITAIKAAAESAAGTADAKPSRGKATPSTGGGDSA